MKRTLMDSFSSVALGFITEYEEQEQKEQEEQNNKKA